jgi:hypothetical protein
MLFEQGELERAACPETERRAALPLAAKMRELADTAAREGFLALGRYESDANPLVAAGIRLLLAEDAQPPLGERLRAEALTGGKSGRELLERMMVAEGMAGLKAGLEARLLELETMAYLGYEVFFAARREAAIEAWVESGLARETAQAIVPE